MIRPIPLVVLSACLALSGCTDDRQAKETAALYGFEDVVTDGYAWGRCGEGDSTATRFHARAQNGACIDGVVCSGWMKGATLRTLGPSASCAARSGDPGVPQSGAHP